jgi:hypothetical protein
VGLRPQEEEGADMWGLAISGWRKKNVSLWGLRDTGPEWLPLASFLFSYFFFLFLFLFSDLFQIFCKFGSSTIQTNP